MQRNSLFLRIVFISLILSGSSFSGFAQNGDHWESIILPGDIWRYILPVTEPASDWNTGSFDDSSWLSGKGGIGYGDNDDSTVLVPPVTSVYMRIRFNVPSQSLISEAVLHIDYDDGFVAYLNGHEIARANIGTPFVRPAFSDFASTCTEPNEPTGGLPSAFIISKDTISRYLVSGENVLAIQVHNCSIGSSDLSSTTFFSALITNGNTYYRPVPAWFSIGIPDVSNLPILSINTNGQAIPDDPKMMATMKVINNGYGKANTPFDKATDYDGPIGIELHGQSSQMFPKKPYSLEIRKTETIDSTASLLGMPSSPDWLLIANYSDKTLLRNALTYYYGAKIGNGWQPRFRFCVVYLNGDYQGIYMLTERIKKDSARVDISTLKETDNSGEELTGGYIVKVDKTWDLQPSEYFTTHPSVFFPNSRYYNFTYVYPKADRITEPQKEYISSYIEEFENVLNGDNFMDPVNGFRKYIDMGTFADYQVMEELSNNVDGYRYSTFFYKNKITHGNKLCAGPLWDFDLCYGNENYYQNNWITTGWLYPNYGPNEGYPMHWWYRLMQDPGYERRFVTRWRELRRSTFRTDSVMHFIDSLKTYFGSEIDKNFQKWQILGVYVWPNLYVFNTYDEEINYLKSWVTDRMNWMDSATDLTSVLYNQSFYDENVVIYPNPVKEKMTVALNLADEGNIRLEFTDLSGRKVSDLQYYVGSGYQELFLDLGTYRTGYYILRIYEESRLLGIKKVIKY